MIFQWLKNRWYRRLRRLDYEILWPACLAQAPDLNHAKAAFALHAFHDKAWLALGHEQLTVFIDALDNYR